VIEGPKKGEVLIIREDISIGRKTGDLILNDSKVSSNHARIYKDEDGNYQLEDLGSSNGTFVDEIKITKFMLKPGNKISIGRSVLEVEPNTSAERPMEQGTWQEVIDSHLSIVLHSFQSQGPQPEKWGKFSVPVVLEFVKGLQTGTTYTYGFGPRKIGKLCPGGLLFDSLAPDIAFELVPSESALCSIKAHESVTVNDKKLTKGNKKIKIGDRISIGLTVIVVRTVDVE
jgi:hypothetical protein